MQHAPSVRVHSIASNLLTSYMTVYLWTEIALMGLQLGKSSLAMEVDAGVLGGRVLAALRAERWRTAAESAVRNPSRATGDSACLAHDHLSSFLDR